MRMATRMSKAVKAQQLIKSLSYIAIGCIINNLVLEVIVSKKANPYADKGGGGMLTFLQFLFIALTSVPAVVTVISPGEVGMKLDDEHYKTKAGGSPYILQLGRLAIKRPSVPFKHYVGMTVVFFAMSYLNNLAFYFNISQPLHMVFRSANLMTTFAIDRFLFKKKYSVLQSLAVIAITVGAASATMAEGLTSCKNCGTTTTPLDTTTQTEATPTQPAAQLSDPQFLLWLVGIGVLFTVLLLQSCLSVYQNWSANKFGRAPQEAMFYSHTLSLFAFMFTAQDLFNRASMWSDTPSTSSVLHDVFLKEGSQQNKLLGYGLWVALSPVRSLPIMWTYALINVVTQLCCAVGVYNLVSLVDPVTVNVALTVRKCASLLLSIYVFGNTFTWLHWVGASLAFGGAAAYSMLSAPAKPAASSTLHVQKASAASDPTDNMSSSIEAGERPLPYRHRKSDLDSASITQPLYPFHQKQI